MNFEPSTYFFEVMRWKSISKAAHELGISQPALSRYLRTIEEKVGKKLYTYGNKTITLTSHGQEFATFLKNRMELERSFFRKMHQGASDVTGKVVLLAYSEVANGWLMDYVGEYLKNNPHVRITVLTTDEKIQWSPEVDMVISSPPVIGDDIESTFLIYSEIKFFAGKEYLEKFGVPTTLTDLENHRLIFLSQDAKGVSRDITASLKMGLQQNIKREPFLQVGSLAALKRAAENNIGIIALGRDYKEAVSSHLMEVLPDFSPFRVALYLYYLKKRKDQEPIKSLRHFLEAEIKKRYLI